MANTTTFEYIKGKVKWHRHNRTNEWGKYSTTIYPDPESLTKIRDLQSEGVKNVIKKDDDGYYVSFTRPAQKEIRGRMQSFSPPLLLNGSVTLEDGTHPPYPPEVNVGNGSDVTLKLEVYQHKTPGGGRAKACRWLTTLVHNLVEYKGKDDLDEEDRRAAKGLDSSQTEPLF